jgi:A/G-specific adenine glycosylase
MPPFPQNQLLSWFKKHRRPLPWRTHPSPYATWISEIMLQQTQVRQVEPYYLRFINLFPNVRVLAEASLEKVLKAWEGMGYYSRARHLHQAAQMIIQHYDEEVPAQLEALLQLPGIGRSTAGAILSLAFNQPLPVLDGNIRRVLSRFFCLNGGPGKDPAGNTLWETAAALLPSRNPGMFNEALMELGALTCSPKKPACPDCPLKKACGAYESGEPERFPAKKPAKAIPHYDVAAAVIKNRGKMLITQRPEKGLLGGLWEFPGGKKEAGESLEECLKREIREELGIEIRVEEKFIAVRHAYSHFRITLHCFFCRKVKGRLRALEVQDFRWVRPDELDRFPFPRADQKVIEFLKKDSSWLKAESSKGIPLYIKAGFGK